MNKISLVQLSQLENKPKFVIYNSKTYVLNDEGEYYNNFGTLHLTILFKYFNEPLIEIVPDSLLSDEEKDILKVLIKCCRVKNIELIQKIEFTDFIKLNISAFDECDVYRINKKYFKKLEDHECYNIKDLGVE